MPAGATVRDLRQGNRARVLRRIMLAEVTTRAQLAAACQLSSASITNVVGDLIAEGLVREAGSVPSDGGRPIARLALQPEGAHLIGAEVGEQRVTVAMFDLAMRPLEKTVVELGGGVAGAAEVSQALTAAVAALRARHPEVASTLAGVGIGVPGLVEAATDPDGSGAATIHADQLGWPATAVPDFCRVDDLPVHADNGANALALAELWFGAARGLEHGAVALVGRGIGLGIISDGRLLRGAYGNAGEWGHTKVSVGGPQCRCGDRGCLEAWAGRDGILARWRERGGPVPGGGDDVAFGALVAAAAAGGDPAAGTVLDETVAVLGAGLASLVNLLNPSAIIVGGQTGRALYAHRSGQLAEVVRARSLPRPGQQCSLRPGALADDAVTRGAAMLPLERVIAGTVRLPRPTR